MGQISPKTKGPREATSPNKVQQQRDNIEQFYDLLKCSKHVKREIQAVFKAFDANKDGSLNINEFRTYLKEPKERMPFLNRIFLTMDNDAMDGAERVNTYGVGELDMFEFFVLTRCPLSSFVRWRATGVRRVDGVEAAPDAIDAASRDAASIQSRTRPSPRRIHRSATTPSAPYRGATTPFGLSGTCTTLEGPARSTLTRSGA